MFSTYGFCHKLMCILSLSLGLTTYSGGRNTGHVMTDALDWTQRQHAGSIENYIIPGDHRRVKGSPVVGPLNPLNFPAGKAALSIVPFCKFVPGTKQLKKFALKPAALVNIALG